MCREYLEEEKGPSSRLIYNVVTSVPEGRTAPEHLISCQAGHAYGIWGHFVQVHLATWVVQPRLVEHLILKRSSSTPCRKVSIASDAQQQKLGCHLVILEKVPGHTTSFASTSLLIALAGLLEGSNPQPTTTVSQLLLLHYHPCVRIIRITETPWSKSINKSPDA